MIARQAMLVFAVCVVPAQVAGVQLGKDLRNIQKMMLANLEAPPAASPNAVLDKPITVRSASMMYAGAYIIINPIVDFVKGAPFELGYAKLSELVLALRWPSSGTIVTPNDLPVVHLPSNYHMLTPFEAVLLAMDIVSAEAAVLFVLCTMVNFSMNTEADAKLKDDELLKDQKLPDEQQANSAKPKFNPKAAAAAALAEIYGIKVGYNAPLKDENSGIEDKPGMLGKKE